MHWFVILQKPYLVHKIFFLYLVLCPMTLLCSGRLHKDIYFSGLTCIEPACSARSKAQSTLLTLPFCRDHSEQNLRVPLHRAPGSPLGVKCKDKMMVQVSTGCPSFPGLSLPLCMFCDHTDCLLAGQGSTHFHLLRNAAGSCCLTKGELGTQIKKL